MPITIRRRSIPYSLKNIQRLENIAKKYKFLIAKKHRNKEEDVELDESVFDSEDEKETSTGQSEDEDMSLTKYPKSPTNSRDVGTKCRFPTFPGLVVSEDDKVKDMSERQNDAITWITKMELMFDMKGTPENLKTKEAIILFN